MEKTYTIVRIEINDDSFASHDISIKQFNADGEEKALEGFLVEVARELSLIIEDVVEPTEEAIESVIEELEDNGFAMEWHYNDMVKETSFAWEENCKGVKLMLGIGEENGFGYVNVGSI